MEAKLISVKAAYRAVFDRDMGYTQTFESAGSEVVRELGCTAAQNLFAKLDAIACEYARGRATLDNLVAIAKRELA